MTPQEKAIELIDKMYLVVLEQRVKQGALIAVDEILKSNPTVIDCDKTELNYKYWTEVKKEIDEL